MFKETSRKHAYIILTPLNPIFYIVKLGFSGVDIIFLSAQNHRLWYSLEPPRRGGSNEYPQSMILSRNMKNILFFFFIWKLLFFLVVKFSIYLNRLVIVMVSIFISEMASWYLVHVIGKKATQREKGQWTVELLSFVNKTSKYSATHSKQSEIQIALVLYMAGDMLTLFTVESPYFRNFE